MDGCMLTIPRELITELIMQLPYSVAQRISHVRLMAMPVTVNFPSFIRYFSVGTVNGKFDVLPASEIDLDTWQYIAYADVNTLVALVK